jgi:hypothetical protein
LNCSEVINNYNFMLYKYSLKMRALHLLIWDIFDLERGREYFKNGSRTKEDIDDFLELQKKLVQLRINMHLPYSDETYDLAERLQGIYGNFELTNEILAEIQLIVDSKNYISAWDKSFNYPNENSPLLRDCPSLLNYLDNRYKIFNLAEIELLGDFEFGFSDFTFNIHPFIPAELNRKLHKMIKADNRIKVNLSLAFQTGIYEKRSSFLPYFQKDYYRGPQFNKDILDNKDGVTEHWRHKEDKESIKGMYLSAFFKKGLKRTEFMWATKNTSKNFVIEEIIEPSATESIDGESCVCVSYTHTQFSLVSGKCVHFDGCMNIYDSPGYQRRLETNIDKRAGAKAKKHMKLFRIDGENVITNDEWILLAGAFFRDNEHVQEYFGNELPWDHQ